MRKIIFCLLLCSFSISFTFSQENFQSKFASADSYISSGYFELARNLLDDILPQLAPDSKDYTYCIDRIAYTYHLQWEEAMNSPIPDKRLAFLEGFLAHIESHKNNLNKSYTQERKHLIYEALIGEYLNLDQGEKAKPYQNKLYYAYKNGMLPDNLKERYSLGQFGNGSVTIFGYEWYEGIPAKNDQGSYTKTIFSIYPSESAGKEDKELIQFHLKRINWIDNNMGDYVLVQRPGFSQSGPTITLWKYSFNDPIDYVELRKTILTLAMSGDLRR